MSIEQHEIELKELLNRVMRDPLQPLQAQLDQTGVNVERLDNQVSRLREVELGGVCTRLDAIEKVLKRLRSWAEEDAVVELKGAILPPVQGALDTLGLRIESQSAAIAQPVQSISQEVEHTAAALERLAEHSVQDRSLAIQHNASLGEQMRDLATHQAEQWRLTQIHVREATGAAVEHLGTMSSTANAVQAANLQRLVDVEVSKRIDKLIIQSRWTIGFAVAAVLAAFGCLTLLLHPLHL